MTDSDKGAASHKVQAIRAKLIGELGREPTQSEVAKRMGVSRQRVSQIYKLIGLNTRAGQLAAMEMKRIKFAEESQSSLEKKRQRLDVLERSIARRKIAAILNASSVGDLEAPWLPDRVLDVLGERINDRGILLIKSLYVHELSIEEAAAIVGSKRNSVYAWRSRFRRSIIEIAYKILNDRLDDASMSETVRRPSSPLPQILTADEVSDFLRVDRKTVYQAVQNGEIPNRRLGRRIIFEREAVLAWLRRDV